MSALNIIAGIFTAVGVLAVTAFILYYVAKALNKYKPSKETDFPSAKYMENVGAKCPSGWIYKGMMTDNDGRNFDVCHNEFNVPVCRDWQGTRNVNGKKMVGCYSSQDQRVAMFPTIDNWDKYIDGDVADDYRCKWINRCGPPSDSPDGSTTCSGSPPAAWVGISEKC